MNDAIIETQGLCKDYRDGDRVHRVLRDLDMEVRRGEFLAIMGPSGCGKTTLLNVLGLLTPATSVTTLRLDDVDCRPLSDRQRTALRREKVGFVFQRFNLLGTVSIAENVRLGLRLKGIQLDGQVDESLECVGLSGLGHRKPGRLSVGEQQRAAIARALACGPDVLLADEPTGNLDSANSKSVMELFRKVHQTHGLTIVMITHNPECAAVADRVLHMKDGRFVDENG